uniref:Uncharacterized protein n=1 Tax=Amphimedon queenslandica TaxID=400682 RepID=A0A1X7UHP2_AMPQE
MSATKRRCTNSDDSPPIVVGIGYKSGSKSYNQTSPRRKNFISKFARFGDSAKSAACEALRDLEETPATIDTYEQKCYLRSHNFSWSRLDSNVKTWQASLLPPTRTQDQINSSDMPSMLEFCDNSNDDEDLHVVNDLHVHYVDTFLNNETSEENDCNGTTMEDGIDETESAVSKVSTPNPLTFSDISNNLDTCNFDEDVSEVMKIPGMDLRL